MAEVLPVVITGEDRSAPAFNSLHASMRNVWAEMRKAEAEMRASMRNVSAEMRKAEAEMRSALGSGVEQMRRSSGVEQLRQTAVAARSTRSEMINLGRQMQDIGVSLASGQSPIMVLVQQGTQVYDVFASSQKGAAGLARDIAALATPARVAAVSLLGVSAALIASATSWKNYALQIDDVARAAGVSAAELSKLQAAAAVKGIGQTDFAAGMKSFADQVYFAKAGMGQLADFMRANGRSVRDFESALGAVANLVRRARDDQERLHVLQRAGLPATMEWIRLLQGGTAGIEEIKRRLGGVNGLTDDAIARARRFDEAWNQVAVNFGQSWRNAFLNVFDGFAKLQSLAGRIRELGGGNTMSADKLRLLRQELGLEMSPQRRIDQAFGGKMLDAPAPRGGVVDDAQLRQRIGWEQQLFGILGPLATVTQQVKQKENELELARLSGVKRLREYTPLILDHARFQAESSRFQERLTAGIFNEAEARQLAQKEIDLDKRRGLISSLEEEAAKWAVVNKRIEEQKTQAEVARSPVEQLTRLGREAGQLNKNLDVFAVNSLNGMTESFADFVTGAKSAQEAFKSFADSVIRDLARMVIRQTLVAPLAQALAGGLGGLLGPQMPLPPVRLGGLYHSGGIVGPGRGGRHVDPAFFLGAPRFHTGGIVGRERPIIALDGEEVGWPKDLARKYGKGDSVQINVQNFGGPEPQITTSRGADGRMVVDMVVGRVMDHIARGGADSLMAERFGVNRRVKRY